MKTNIYVDAFNLYYGCLNKTPYKWLDIQKLCMLEMPRNTANRIRVFAARVKARPNDPDQANRQQIYFRALGTTPNLTLHFGTFLSHPVRMPNVNPADHNQILQTYSLVMKTEEKGSDVNLATYMLIDAFDRDCEAMILISNDSDLAEPVRQVRKRFNIPVVVLHPCRPGKLPSIQLKQVASKSQIIGQASLIAAQFPTVLTDSNGRQIHKPPSW